ncbi:helix-turn-helix domain-containing protein [Caloranaerobacter sp. DY30410]|uniref:helix-turn-helix domain-containing protein n=1 Tax=Caloranaerobacter sp. DY30410 TaxID=3238305 RepID=UPI003CFECD6A
MTVGDNIRRIAQEKNISFYRICKKARISSSYMSELVNNKRNNPSLIVLKKISDALEVPIEELIKS